MEVVCRNIHIKNGCAISKGEKVIYNDYEVWEPDIEKCTKMRTTNTKGSSCGRCIKTCPWNKSESWYHRLATGMVQKSSGARKVLVGLDDLLGYGKPHPSEKWWFDFEKVGDKLVVPKK